METSEQPLEYLLSLATVSRDRLLAKCRFFLSRDDILEKLHNLDISDGWRFTQVVAGQSVFDATFYQPIYRAFNDVLGGAGKLTCLQLHKIIIDMDLARTISNLHNLHTVELSRCRVTTDVQQVLMSDEIPILWTPVYNLRLLFLFGTEDDDLWYSFLLCPQLRTFAAFRPVPNDVGSLPPPPSQIWGRGSSFDTMERLSISELGFEDNMGFADWFRSFPDKPKLTHFKLSSGPGLRDGEVYLILTYLAAPLKVLVVDGLAKASFSLIHAISMRFPGLLGLTLIRRAGTRQLRCRPVIWPHAPWEYARHMRGFTQLQHFCWNLASHRPSPTSAALLEFEEGFPDPQNDFLGWKTAYERENFDDDKWTPVLFGLSCPKLQTYSEEQYRTEWQIRRPFNGPISAERLSDEYPLGRCKWNTDSDDWWPAIVPGESGNQ